MPNYSYLFIPLLVTVLSSCASVGDLPSSSAEIDFSAPDKNLTEHALDTPGYELSYHFPNNPDLDMSLAMKASRAGIIYAGLDIERTDIEGHFVTGHRGPDIGRNIEYAGVYLLEDEKGIRAKIFVFGESFGTTFERQLGYIYNDITAGIEKFIKAEMRQRKLNK